MTLNKDKCVQNSVVLMMNGMKTGLKIINVQYLKESILKNFRKKRNV
jgi:hypothetical protein